MLIVIGITLLIIHTAVYVYHTFEINKVFTTLIYNINTYFPSERQLRILMLYNSRYIHASGMTNSKIKDNQQLTRYCKPMHYYQMSYVWAVRDEQW